MMLHSEGRKPIPDVTVRIATAGKIGELFRVFAINGVYVEHGDVPGVGDTVTVVPIRFHTDMRARTLTIVSIGQRGGIDIYCTN
jgi:hypothetical protein